MNRLRLIDRVYHLPAILLAAGSLAGGSGKSFAQLTQSQSVTLYETGFEHFEGFSPDADLIGQGLWVGDASDLSGAPAPFGGNGVLDAPVHGFVGQYAYIGFDAPAKTADFNVWHPAFLDPSSPPFPLVRFRVSFQIEDSTSAAPWFDDFRWSIYGIDGHRFVSLDFDNELREVNFILDENNPVIRSTGFIFDNSVPYDLEMDLNLQRNLWTARINGVVIVHNQPITTIGTRLTFGDADAVWVIREPGKPGDNYMIFDDYRITVEPLSNIPPTLEPVGMLNTGAFVIRILGEPGVTYLLEGTESFQSWTSITTGIAQSPGGYVDLQDGDASKYRQRLYRARSVPQ